MTMLDQAYDLYDAGALAQSADACRQILRDHPASFPALYLLGTVLGEQQSLQAGIDCLKQAVALRPEVKAAQFNLASLLAKAGAFADALPHVAQALSLAPDDGEALQLKASCHHALGQIDPAPLRAALAGAIGAFSEAACSSLIGAAASAAGGLVHL